MIDGSLQTMQDDFTRNFENRLAKVKNMREVP